MMFTPERLTGLAMLVFGKERLVTVLCNSPLHDSEVAVVELCTPKESFEGAICLKALLEFTGIVNLTASDVYIREQGASTIELWLFAPKHIDYAFDNDPTPVDGM